MRELITTGIITFSSVLLFGYWVRCAWLLIRGRYPTAQSREAAQPPQVLQSR